MSSLFRRRARCPGSGCRCRGGRASRRASFWSSIRNWRRCSKRACRWCSRSICSSSGSTRRCSSGSSTTCTSGCDRAVRCRMRLPPTASLLPSIYTASLLAGERSGSLDAVLRRFVEYSKTIATVKRKTVSALVYPVILISLAIMLVSIIVLKVVPAFSDFYAVVRRRAAAHHQDHRPHLRCHASAVRADSAGCSSAPSSAS